MRGLLFGSSPFRHRQIIRILDVDIVFDGDIEPLVVDIPALAARELPYTMLVIPRTCGAKC